MKSLIFQGDVFGLGFEFCWGIPLRSTPVPQAGKPDCSPAWPQQGGKESWTPHGSSAVFWSQAKSAEQLISKIIFPTQYSDVTAFIKNEGAPKTPPKSPLNAKRSNFFQEELYLNSETNFFPYWFLLAHRAQKTGGARATTTLFF